MPNLKKKQYIVLCTNGQNENLKRLGLKERQIKAVMHVKEKGKITNKEYRSMFDISDRTALSDLNDLCEKGFLGKVGITGRSTAYELSRSKPEKTEKNPN